MITGLQNYITPNGDLQLWMPKEADRLELIQFISRSDKSDVDAWYEILEPEFTNGGLQPINPEAHYVDLTSDPFILGQDVTLEDSGALTCYGKLWHYPEYMISSPVERIAAGMMVTLKCFDDSGKEARTLEQV